MERTVQLKYYFKDEAPSSKYLYLCMCKLPSQGKYNYIINCTQIN